MLKGIIVLGLVSILLCSCMVGPDFHDPSSPNVTRYTQRKLPKTTVKANNQKAGRSQTFVVNQQVSALWWHAFRSQSLNRLIDLGLRNNFTLKEAKARLEQARQIVKADTGNLLLPAVDLNVSAKRTQVSGLEFANPSGGNLLNIYNIKGTVSYNLDIFGGSRRQIEADIAKANYQRYELLAAYLTLTGNITTTAITVASLEAQIKATQSLINSEEELLGIMKKQLAFGGVAEEDVFTQATTVAQTQARLPPLAKKLAVEQHLLAVLVGQFPANIRPLSLKLSSLSLPYQLPVSLPSQLVRQRPDIRAAEEQLHQASAAIGVATAALLPQVSLSAGLGSIAGSPGDLFTPASKLWSIGSNLLQPIFHGTALIAQRRAVIAAYRAQYASYQQTVLLAFANVGDTLRAINLDAKAYRDYTQAELFAYRTLGIAQKNYKFGGNNYLTVLTAQNNYLTSKISQIESAASRLTDTAALFVALGGGWWNNQDNIGSEK